MASIGNLIVNIGAKIDGLRHGLTDAQNMVQSTSSRMGSLAAGLGRAALGATVGLGLMIGAAGSGAAAIGLDFNSQVEQVTARLNSFTKSGSVTAGMIEDIKAEAAKTPFAFTEMANATAALMPAAKQSGTAVMDLIKEAEILAASNPSQGLEGAAFALKEAVGGDFTSIIERFNLPRQYINQLKAQGVPALEAVRLAMQQLGLDSSLVTNMANTMSGRWSTLKDTFTNLAGTITQPIFSTLSSGLGQVNSILEKNGPAIQAFADGIATGLGGALQSLGGAFQTIQAGDVSGTVMNISSALSSLGAPPSFIEFVQNLIPQAVQKFQDFKTALGETNAIERIGAAIDRIVIAFGGVPTPAGAAGTAATEFGSVLDAVVGTVEMVTSSMEGIAWGVEKANEATQIAVGLWDQLTTIWANIKMPDLQLPTMDTSGIPEWLIPHSPPPFATGLEQVNEQMTELYNNKSAMSGTVPMVERIGNIARINASNYNQWSAKDQLAYQKQFNQGDGIAEDGSRVGAGYYRNTEIERLEKHLAAQEEYQRKLAENFSQQFGKKEQSPDASAQNQELISQNFETLYAKIQGQPVETTVNLDGQTIAKVVSHRQGKDVTAQLRMGGRARI